MDYNVYLHTHFPPSIAKVIGTPTCHTLNIYTVVFKNGSILDYTEDLLSEAPTSAGISASSLLPSLVKGGANNTLFLNGVSKPQHGTFQLSDTQEWYFYPGKSTSGIILPDLAENYLMFMTLVDCSEAMLISLCDFILRHVSAHG